MTADIGSDITWITESPEDGVAVRSKPFTLQCHSTLPNATYLWMYNNRTLDLVNDSRRQILPNGSLFFKTVSNFFVSGSNGLDNFRDNLFSFFIVCVLPTEHLFI